MPNYRYVLQGEYYITTDPNTVLVTTGMTDCIGIAFIDKNNPNNRLVAHIDGFTLYNSEIALKNLMKMKEDFISKTKSSDIHIHMLGGNRTLRNYRILLPILDKWGYKIVQITDTHELCSQFNKKSPKLFSPLNVDATLICPASGQPILTPFKPSLFEPKYSEKELADGKGLTSPKDQDQFSLFSKINEVIFNKFQELAQTIRTSDDLEWIKENMHLLEEVKPTLFQENK